MVTRPSVAAASDAVPSASDPAENAGCIGNEALLGRRRIARILN
jgi:hypothetical protein